MDEGKALALVSPTTSAILRSVSGSGSVLAWAFSMRHTVVPSSAMPIFLARSTS
jgi:hypothetical protein